MSLFLFFYKLKQIERRRRRRGKKVLLIFSEFKASYENTVSLKSNEKALNLTCKSIKAVATFSV